MIQDLRKRVEAKIEKIQEMFNKDLEELKNKHLEELKNKQTKMNNTITEMKYTLEGISSRTNEAEERISDLEDRMVEFTATEQNKEKRKKRNEDSLRDLWDNIRCNNIRIDKPLARVIKKKRERTQINKIRNDKRRSYNGHHRNTKHPKRLL